MKTKSSKTAKFQTPHEKKATEKKGKAAVPPAAAVLDSKPSKAASKAARDAFGGRIGTRMSAINLFVLSAKEKGATVQEVAKATGESTSIVSAQLGWMVTQKKVATRKEEKIDGKKTFRYFAATK
ncbi:MAG: hypothetical protein AB9869_05495 [Verrucomicrobiia bacterium]